GYWKFGFWFSDLRRSGFSRLWPTPIGKQHIPGPLISSSVPDRALRDPPRSGWFSYGNLRFAGPACRRLPSTWTPHCALPRDRLRRCTTRAPAPGCRDISPCATHAKRSSQNRDADNQFPRISDGLQRPFLLRRVKAHALAPLMARLASLLESAARQPARDV